MLTANAVKARRAVERRICRRFILLALKRGYTISVDNGDEIVLVKSSNVKKIMSEMFSVDEESLVVYNHGSFVGRACLVYGNDGWDVIADHTTSPAMDSLMNELQPLIDKLS